MNELNSERFVVLKSLVEAIDDDRFSGRVPFHAWEIRQLLEAAPKVPRQGQRAA
jgi:hypothetical protein